MEHDLLNEDDFFEQLKKDKQKAKQPQEEKPKEEIEEPEITEEPLETDLFEMEEEEERLAFEEEKVIDSVPEPEEEEVNAEVGGEPPLEPHPFEEESFEAFDEDVLGSQSAVVTEKSENFEEEINEQEAPPETPPKKIYIPEDKVEDEKLPSLSKRPVIVWSVVVITVIVALFALYMFFSNKGPEEKPLVQEQKQESQQPQKPVVNPIIEKQNEYLTQVAAENNQSLSVIGAITGITQKNKVQISSLLFYGGDLSFEMFGQNRDQLARALKDIKATFNGIGVKVIASDERPGDGITSVISLRLQNKGSGAAKLNAKLGKLNEAEQWLGTMARQFSVSITPIKELVVEQAQFNLKQHRIHFKVNGTYDNCLKFLAALGQSNRNMKVYKLVVSSLDQKSFNKSKYQVEIIADLYL